MWPSRHAPGFGGVQNDELCCTFAKGCGYLRTTRSPFRSTCLLLLEFWKPAHTTYCCNPNQICKTDITSGGTWHLAGEGGETSCWERVSREIHGRTVWTPEHVLRNVDMGHGSSLSRRQAKWRAGRSNERPVQVCWTKGKFPRVYPEAVLKLCSFLVTLILQSSSYLA